MSLPTENIERGVLFFFKITPTKFLTHLISSFYLFLASAITWDNKVNKPGKNEMNNYTTRKNKQPLDSLLLFLIYSDNLKQDFLMLCSRFDMMPDTKFDFNFNFNDKVGIIVKSFNNKIAVAGCFPVKILKSAKKH